MEPDASCDKAAALNERLGVALGRQRCGDLAQAEAQYRLILQEYPQCFDAWHLLAVCAFDRGSPHEAITLARRAIAANAHQAAAYLTLARALLSVGEAQQAFAHLEQCLRLEPARADAWFMAGNLHFEQGRFEAAAGSYARAAALQPDFSEAFNNHSAAARASRQLDAAFSSASRALRIDPNYAKAYNNRGLVHLDRYRVPEAVLDFQRALALQPDFAEAAHNLGTALLQQRRFGEARDVFRRLAALAPGFLHVHGNLLRAKRSCCDWQGVQTLTAAVVSAVGRGEHADLPLSFLNVSDSAAAQLRCARAYVAARYPPVPRAGPRADVPRIRGELIRVAYLSGDFGEHAVSHLLAGVFERHDRSRFETIALSWDRSGEGAMRQRVERAFSRFIDVTSLADTAVERMIRELHVDIAVDLTGHTLGQRSAIFAARAAPVQVNLLGLPATMGAAYIDYLIADAFLVPQSQFIDYAERVVWLPCFQPNDDRRTQLATCSRAECGLPDAAFVFGSFNTPSKLSPECFDIWMRLLIQVDTGVLWILADNELMRSNLRLEAQRRGVAAERLVFADRVPHGEYLARLSQIDLFLDSFPFNGGTTSSDALSMGVPVLTCAGRSFSSRMSGSLLTYLGIPELITQSLQEYEAAAVALAMDRPRLRRLRSRLAATRRSHRFFDTDHYRVCLEAAYQRMHWRTRQGLTPVSFATTDPLDLNFQS